VTHLRFWFVCYANQLGLCFALIVPYRLICLETLTCCTLNFQMPYAVRKPFMWLLLDFFNLETPQKYCEYKLARRDIFLSFLLSKDILKHSAQFLKKTKLPSFCGEDYSNNSLLLVKSHDGHHLIMIRAFLPWTDLWLPVIKMYIYDSLEKMLGWYGFFNYRNIVGCKLFGKRPITCGTCSTELANRV